MPEARGGRGGRVPRADPRSGAVPTEAAPGGGREEGVPERHHLREDDAGEKGGGRRTLRHGADGGIIAVVDGRSVAVVE